MPFIQFISDGVNFWQAHHQTRRSPMQSLSMMVVMLVIGMLLMVAGQGYRMNQAIGQTITDVRRLDIPIVENKAILPKGRTMVAVNTQGLTVQLDNKGLIISNQRFEYINLTHKTKSESSHEQLSTRLSNNRGALTQSLFLSNYTYAAFIIFAGLILVSLGTFLYRSQVNRWTRVHLLDALYTASADMVVPILVVLVFCGLDIVHSLTTVIFLISYLLCLFISGRVEEPKKSHMGAQTYGDH